MSTTTLITIYLRRKAANRLRSLGHEVDGNSTLQELAEAVAKVRGMVLPSSLEDRTLLVRAFSQRQGFIPRDCVVDAAPFVPLKLSKPMLEAIERAHELYAIPSLPDRLEAERCGR
jgi:hypothetical protein